MTSPTPLHATLQCRQCGADELDDLGRIPAAEIFAGQQLDPPWSGGLLYRCRRCHLVFRHPIRTEAEYENLYAKASENIWVSDALRVDQKLVLASIEAACASGKVLDVGCYDGALLASLGPSYQRYGVEASVAACTHAQRRGVEIVASKIRDLSTVEMQFDVICAVDVIEHVPDPRRFIATLADCLAPGGRLIISTGSPDSPAWRFAGGLYWYCGFAEHISFIDEAWAHAVGVELGLGVAFTKRFAYGESEGRALRRSRRRFYRKLAVAKLLKKLHAWWPSVTSFRSPQRSLGSPGLFEDHMIVCFKRVSHG